MLPLREEEGKLRRSLDLVAWLTVFLMASTSHPSRDCSQVIDHSHVPEFEVATWIKITLILVYLVIFVVGILGNSVTIRVTQVLQKKGYLQKEVTDHMVSYRRIDLPDQNMDNMP